MSSITADRYIAQGELFCVPVRHTELYWFYTKVKTHTDTMRFTLFKKKFSGFIFDI